MQGLPFNDTIPVHPHYTYGSLSLGREGSEAERTGSSSGLTQAGETSRHKVKLNLEKLLDFAFDL